MVQLEISLDNGARQDAIAARPERQETTESSTARTLLETAESFGASLGLLSFHRIIQDASRRLVVGAAAESSASSLGLDLFRSTGKDAL